MRTQAIEKLLKLIVKESKGAANLTPNMKNYMAKAEIILNRDDDRDASVIRELINQ